MEMMTTKANSFIRIMTVSLCAGGTTTTRVTFRRDLPRETGCPPDWKNSLHGAATLPPGLQKRLQPCPDDLERQLPPPPPECAHVLIGGHIVLLNQRTSVVVDIVHFEI